jgi:hypothetical protein
MSLGSGIAGDLKEAEGINVRFCMGHRRFPTLSRQWQKWKRPFAD